MFRRIEDFVDAWHFEAKSTHELLSALSDEALPRAIAPGHWTAAELAWHLTRTIPEMMARTGLVVEGLPQGTSRPTRAADIAQIYQACAASLARVIAERWRDETLEESDDMYGQVWQRGQTLLALIAHQAHHRGQLSVLLRQAGLRPPGIYGPAKEDWAKMGMEPPPA